MAAAPHPPPPQDPREPGRRIVASPGLPGGRAVVGGLLVALAGVGTFAAASGTGAEAEASYVVAGRDLPPGTVLAAGDLAVVRGAVPVATRDRVYASAEAVVGAVTAGPLAEGELVQAGALVAAGDAEPTFSIAVDRAAADAGSLRAGDRVEVLATYGTDAGATTLSLSSQARVVATDGSDDLLGSGGQLVVRLAVADPAERSAILHASVAARLALVRTTGAPAHDPVERFGPLADATGDEGAP